MKEFFNKILLFLREAWFHLRDAERLFLDKRGATLAAASSFYLVLTIIPSLLLIIRLAGFFVGDIQGTIDQIFEFAHEFFPSALPDFVFTIKEMVQGPLFASPKFTFFNFLFLIVSSLSFFNSIWSGLFLMTEDDSHRGFVKHLKGLVIIATSIVILVFLLGIRPSVVFLFNKLNSSFPLELLLQSFPELKPGIESFQVMALSQTSIFHSTSFYFLLFLSYFTFLYRWFFSWTISWLQSLAGSFSFVLVLILGRQTFWLYLSYVRKGLIDNYGDFYTVVVGLIWVFLVMNFFFYGACLCHTFQKRAVGPK